MCVRAPTLCALLTLALPYRLVQIFLNTLLIFYSGFGQLKSRHGDVFQISDQSRRSPRTQDGVWNDLRQSYENDPHTLLLTRDHFHLDGFLPFVFIYSAIGPVH